MTTDDSHRPARIAGEYGTPVYVYDLAEIRRAHAELRTHLPADSAVFYSLKANPHPEVVRELVRGGARPEVCSTGELDVALAAGASPQACLYTGPGKTAAEIDHALAAGVRRFSVESPTDLQRLGSRARRAGTTAQVLLRLNPVGYPSNAGLAMGGTSSQFGADVDWVCAEPELFGADGVDVIGYHVYIGSNSADAEQLANWFGLGLDAVSAAHKALGGEVQIIDLGGGFGSPYARSGTRPALGTLGARLPELIAERLGAGIGEPEIAFESGRYLVGTAGSLVIGVQDVKVSQGVRYVVADGGINTIGGMQGLRRVPPLVAEARSMTAPDHISETDDHTTGHTAALPTVLTGPLCTTLDVLNPKAGLTTVAPGDLLVVPNVGAYGVTASLIGFLGRQAPAEVTVDGDRTVSALRLRLDYTDAAPLSKEQ